MSVNEKLLADFPSQRAAAAELKVCERRSAGIILPKICEFLPPNNSADVRLVREFNLRRQMSVNEKLLADFPSQRAAAAELKVCERRSAGIILPKICEFLPPNNSADVRLVREFNLRRQMSVTEKLLADFLTQEEAAAELKVCERTLDRWRRLDEGPPITKLGRRTLYRRSSLQAWLRAREHRGNVNNSVGVRPRNYTLSQ